jgi:hypothetical protein
LWIIANITYSNSVCETLVKKGIISISINILALNNQNYNDHLLAILGNLAVDDVKYRDMILAAGGLQLMFQAFNISFQQRQFENVIWAITNLCRGTPSPNYALI